MSDPIDIPQGGDAPVTCGLCGHETSVAMIVEHLAVEHGFDREELAEAIAEAPIIDMTGEDD